MSVSYTCSHKKWKNIVSLLKRIQTPNRTRVAHLKGVEKRRARENITLMGRSKTLRNEIPNIIRLISQECSKYKDDSQVTILLDEYIYYLIQRLNRRHHIKIKKSASILTTPIL